VNQNNKNSLRGRRFTAEIILRALRCFLQFLVIYRDLERMFSDRGVHVDQMTLFRSFQVYAPELAERIHPQVAGDGLHPSPAAQAPQPSAVPVTMPSATNRPIAPVHADEQTCDPNEPMACVMADRGQTLL